MKQACCSALLVFSGCRLLAQTPSLIQSTKCQDWTDYVVTYSCSFNQPTTPGNAIIAFGLVSGSPSVVVTGIADDHPPKSNPYALDLHYLIGDVQNIYFYSSGNAGAARRVTMTANTSTHFQMILMEVRGLATSGTLSDRTSVNDNGYNSGRTFTSGLTHETTQPDEFLVGWNEQIYPNVMTFTDDSPWTLVEQQPIGGSRIAYRTANTKGTYAYTGTFAGAGEYRVGAAIVTYKAALPNPHHGDRPMP